MIQNEELSATKKEIDYLCQTYDVQPESLRYIGIIKNQKHQETIKKNQHQAQIIQSLEDETQDPTEFKHTME